MVVLLVDLEMFGKFTNSLTEQRYLDFRRTRVSLMLPEFNDDFILLLFFQCHLSVNSSIRSALPFFYGLNEGVTLTELCG